MHFTTASALAVLAFTTSVFARPDHKKPVNIKISGVASWDAVDVLDFPANETYYLSYQQNYWLGMVLTPTKNHSEALNFNVMPNGTLESTTGMALSIIPLDNEGYGLPTIGKVAFGKYNGSEGTTMSRPRGEIINSDPEFGAWAVCTSQYGMYIDYVSPLWNQTAEDEGQYPFKCYNVKFHARHWKTDDA